MDASSAEAEAVRIERLRADVSRPMSVNLAGATVLIAEVD